MAEFNIKTNEIIEASQDIAEIFKRLENVKSDINGINVSKAIKSKAGFNIDITIDRICNGISNQAVQMKTMGEALKTIVNFYKNSENTIIDKNNEAESKSKKANTERGTDKRNLWNKFLDWITGKNADEYDTTSKEQEKAADNAIKKKMWNVLQDEKYSEENWDKATTAERKKILQDYMEELIKIYGLEDVKTKIVWSSDKTYTQNSVTWGSYSHGTHTVTLNEKVLSDKFSSWDSYELLATVSHELRHAYQHEAVDNPTKFMVSKETIDAWDKNFDNYINSSDDYEGYRKQAIEADAREFEINRNSKI